MPIFYNSHSGPGDKSKNSSRRVPIFYNSHSGPGDKRKNSRTRRRGGYISGFCTPFVLRGGGGGGWGPAPGAVPPRFFQGGGGLFNSRGASLGQISIIKIIIFSDDFPVIFWYIHMMLLH